MLGVFVSFVFKGMHLAVNFQWVSFSWWLYSIAGSQNSQHAVISSWWPRAAMSSPSTLSNCSLQQLPLSWNCLQGDTPQHHIIFPGLVTAGVWYCGTIEAQPTDQA